jgi:hypothetical protein
MFLAPVIAVAGLYELISAVSATEKHTQTANTTTTAPKRTVALSPSGTIIDHKPTNKPTNEPGMNSTPYTVQEPEEESKELVVFSEKANKQQGLTVFGTNREVGLTETGIRTACAALAGLLPFTTFGYAESACEVAANELAKKGIELTKAVVFDKASSIINKMKGKVNKTEIKKEVMQILNKASRSGTAQKYSSNNTLGGGGGSKVAGRIHNAPVAKAVSTVRNSKPRTRSTPNGVIITHTEMVSTIATGSFTSNTSAYACSGFRLNPGMPSVFPWLSSVAVNYEKYRFRRLSFVGMPLVATNYSGRYGIGMDYDSTDVVPATRQEFYALSAQAESMPWDPIALNIKCDNQYRFTGTHTTNDSKLIDIGQVIVMSDAVSNGGTLTSPVGLFDLIVEYEVELIQPQQALFATTEYIGGAASLAVGDKFGIGTNTISVYGPQIVTRAPVVISTTNVTVYLPYGTYALTYMFNWSAGAATGTATAGSGTAIKGTVFAGTAYITAIIHVNVTASEGSVALGCGTVSYATNLLLMSLGVTRVTPTFYAALP